MGNSDSAHAGTRFAAVNGAEIAYDVTGTGLPVVLVHAGIADRRMWDDQVAELARTHRVIRFDARGFGETVKPPVDFSPVADLLGLLDHLGLERVALLGCSMGAKTVLEAAISAPDRITALIVSGALLGVDYSDGTIAAWEAVDELTEAGNIAGAVERELRMWIDGEGRPADAVDPAVRERVRVMEMDLFTRDDQVGDEQRLKPPVAERLGEIAAPTLAIWGDLDNGEVIQTGELLAASIPNAETRVIANTAHLPNMEQSAEFNRIVNEFLERTTAR